MSAADPRAARLSQLSECAARMGVAFATASEQAQGTDKWLEYFHAFDRCFFAVRVATALELRLAREGRSSVRPELRSDREDLRDRELLIERCDVEAESEDESPERDPPERDRDGEVERASFPILVNALERVADDASRLPGPAPADLPTLRELLAHVRAEAPAPAPAPAAKVRAGLKTRLAGAGAAVTAAPDRRPASNVGAVLAARRATGPPRR